MGLKKEFTEREVQRMRNLIKGDHHKRTISGVGYSKKHEDYKEGDVWEEDGRKWTIKEGIKQNITKLDEAKKIAIQPLFCPNCNKVMKKKNDKIFYRLHKKCFDCVVDFEHNLKKEGKWEDYQKKIKNQEIDSMIEDFQDFMKEKRYEQSNSYVTEAGDVERWVGSINQEKVDKYIKETVEYLENLKQ